MFDAKLYQFENYFYTDQNFDIYSTKHIFRVNDFRVKSGKIEAYNKRFDTMN